MFNVCFYLSVRLFKRASFQANPFHIEQVLGSVLPMTHARVECPARVAHDACGAYMFKTCLSQVPNLGLLILISSFGRSMHSFSFMSHWL